MATKGPKAPAKPVASKPAARASKPAAPKAVAVAAKAEKKPAPETVIEAAAPVNASGPDPVVEVASQEAVETVQAAAEPAEVAVADIVNAPEAVAETVAEPIVKETITMATTFENNTAANTAKAQALFADWNDRTKAAVEKSTKLVEEANDFAKGNLEAVVESGRIAAKGFEALGQDAAEYGRKSFESATTALKTLATVKSPTEFFKLQSDFVRGAFDAYVAEASKNTEAVIKLAGDAAQPISNRFAVAAEKVKTNA
ncbi:phasin family protein [Sphingomonas naasensis]|uniref:Phasin family protein n=1 Tax=Sphingomonas naasensis TaxID=1344951 RepID=A0A4S1WGQ2_9SPHN|nr:phasin family protein [Sphingomonas naasensis]NIJ19891.1 phasin family protein [Sphingomonas naasensis]TGX39986.1 phasin family protein [Sphingomonas naasensis]